MRNQRSAPSKIFVPSLLVPRVLSIRLTVLQMTLSRRRHPMQIPKNPLTPVFVLSTFYRLASRGERSETSVPVTRSSGKNATSKRRLTDILEDALKKSNYDPEDLSKRTSLEPSGMDLVTPELSIDDEDEEEDTQEIDFELPGEETDDSEAEADKSEDKGTKDKKSIAGISLEDMKRLSDDQYFRLFMKMALKKKKPVRVRLPAMRLVDTGDSTDIKKLKEYVHRLFGHLSDEVVFEACTNEQIEGVELLKIIILLRGKTPSPHCDSCAENKASIPPIPKGKIDRPKVIKRAISCMWIKVEGLKKRASIMDFITTTSG